MGERRERGTCGLEMNCYNCIHTTQAYQFIHVDNAVKLAVSVRVSSPQYMSAPEPYRA